MVIGKDKHLPYSDNLIDGLSKLEDDYIILLHEDFYITDPVDTERIRNLLEYAREIGAKRVSLQCTKDGYEGWVTKIIPGVYRVNYKFQYMCSFEASIWHRETLLNNVLQPGENPWQTEVLGSRRNPNMNVIVTEDTVVKYSDARIHGEQRIKLVDGVFHKMVGDDLWESLGVRRDDN